MSLLTDTDILKYKANGEIIIEPFDENNLTPVGYDLTVGSILLSLQRGLLDLGTDGEYHILSREVILVLSKEYVEVSEQIGGTFHSKVSMVSRGFSHIATTLDPRWKGYLLIATTNLSEDELTLKPGQQYVTLVFYRARSRAKKQHGKAPARLDIMLEQISRTNPKISQDEADRSRKQLILKLSQVISEQDRIIVERRLVADQANTNIVGRKVAAANAWLFSRGRKYTISGLYLIIIFIIIYLGLNIESIIPSLKLNTFAPVAFTATVPFILALLKQLSE
mgnify:CR=1 FL=1